MSDATPETNRQLNKPLIFGVVAVVILAIVVFLLLPEDKPEPQRFETAVTEPEPEPVVRQPVSVALPEPEPEVIPEPAPEPIAQVQPEPEPEPELDLSDGAIKTALLAVSKVPQVARLIVDDDLLRRFVVFSNNLANEEIVENHHLLHAPERPFRVYQQAGKEWIDAASYKRYSPYVDALESMSTEDLIALYQDYQPAIGEIYAEVGNPDDDFSSTLAAAIEHLLDTPEIPFPVEVYTDSVMYKFADQRIEELSAVQKQLLRTGPENMRRIKSKLRELKDALSNS